MQRNHLLYLVVVVVVYLLCWVLDVQGMREAGKRENNAAELIHSADGKTEHGDGMVAASTDYGLTAAYGSTSRTRDNSIEDGTSDDLTVTTEKWSSSSSSSSSASWSSWRLLSSGVNVVDKAKEWQPATVMDMRPSTPNSYLRQQSEAETASSNIVGEATWQRLGVMLSSILPMQHSGSLSETSPVTWQQLAVDATSQWTQQATAPTKDTDRAWTDGDWKMWEDGAKRAKAGTEVRPLMSALHQNQIGDEEAGSRTLPWYLVVAVMAAGTVVVGLVGYVVWKQRGILYERSYTVNPV